MNIDEPPRQLNEQELAEHVQAVSDAVEKTLAALYGEQEPARYGAIEAWADGGPDPLDEVAIYWNPKGPHWHYVTYGMAEHGQKASSYAEVSGWGFEFSLRLAAPAELTARAEEPASDQGTRVLWVTTQAPTWPIALLNELARFVFESRKPFQHGNFIQRPGAPFLPTLGFVREPALPLADTPNGRFVWQQVVALTDEQRERLKGDDWERLLEEMRQADPHLLIHPEQGPQRE